MSPIALVVHGGAGPGAPDDVPSEREEGALRAARAGYAILRAGGSAIEAVTVAASLLEDDPQFNAGTGGALNADGEVELDASLMDGATLSAGAVAAVRTVRNPIQLARQVMEQTPHVLFAGPGAERLARELGLPAVDPATLVTSRARTSFERWRASTAAPSGHGTIGAVALDARGHLAAATSTGGTTGKRPGRVGDSPLIGAGTYADDLTGGVSCTGHGESILKVVLAKHVCDLLGTGLDAQTAAERGLSAMDRVRGEGGLICLDRQGRIGHAFNSQRMTRAGIDAQGREFAGFERT